MAPRGAPEGSRIDGQTDRLKAYAERTWPYVGGCAPPPPPPTAGYSVKT